MSYRLATFNGVALPLYNPGAGPASLPALDAYTTTLSGRLFDSWGAGVARPAPGVVTHEGIYKGASISETRIAYEGLLGQRGRRGVLVRRLLGSSATHAIFARLESVAPPTYEQSGISGCTVKTGVAFRLLSDCWDGVGHDVLVDANPDPAIFDADPLLLALVESAEGSGATSTLINSGNARQPHFTATLTVGGASPTDVVGIRNYTTGDWLVVIDSGNPFYPGQKIVFDTITTSCFLLDGAGVYLRSLFGAMRFYGSSTEWFGLAPGDNEVEAGFGGATGTGFTARYQYSDGWN